MSSIWKLSLPDTIFEQLRCSMCNEYLSQLPVYSYQGQEGVVCSRCPVLTEQSPTRIVPYELIAKFIQFPCRYKSFGCLETIVPFQIQNHEEGCLYKQHFCPFMPLGFCPWQGSSSGLFEHYETEHKVLALRQPTTFEIDLQNKHAVNYLLLYREHLFIVKLKYEENETMCCLAFYVGSKIMAQKFMFQIELCKVGSLEQLVLPKKNVLSDTQTAEDDLFVSRINTACLEEQFANPSSIICKITILSHGDIDQSTLDSPDGQILTSTILGDVDEEMLRDLECPVCREYMVPPIPICLTGHSICSTCKAQVTRCPTCKGRYGTTRNYGLENITKHIKYPCKFRDIYCPFIGNHTEIKQHEEECIHGPQNCPLKEFAGCNWNGKGADIMMHARTAHEDNILNVDLINVAFEKDNLLVTQDCFLINAFDKTFKLDFCFRDETFMWNIRYIGAKEDAKNYMYEIDITDNSGLGKRVYFKRICEKLTTALKDMYKQSSWVKLESNLVSPLINDGVLTYRCHVLKTNQF